jgi:hypothetical protein
VAGRARRPFNPPSSGTKDKGHIKVPRIVTDAVMSLRPWPIEMTVAGQDVQIPALPAADWLSVLMVENLVFDDVLMNLAPDVAEVVDQALFDGSITFDDYSKLLLDLISTVSGRPWHKALRLIAVVHVSWDVIGAELEFKGIDATEVSLGAWLDVALIALLKNLEEKDIPLFVTRLEAPAPGAEEEEMTMAPDDFAALVANQ